MDRDRVDKKEVAGPEIALENLVVESLAMAENIS